MTLTLVCQIAVNLPKNVTLDTLSTGQGQSIIIVGLLHVLNTCARLENRRQHGQQNRDGRRRDNTLKAKFSARFAL